jgi:hypothetical protein
MTFAKQKLEFIDNNMASWVTFSLKQEALEATNQGGPTGRLTGGPIKLTDRQ